MPYELYVEGQVSQSDFGIRLSFRNAGKAGAAFHVRFDDGQTEPRTYTVDAGDDTSDTIASIGITSYGLAVYGPNGFQRTFAGSLAPGSANLNVDAAYDKGAEGIALVIHNHGSSAETVSIVDSYSGKEHSRTVHPGNTETFVSQLHKSFGWYDLTVTAQSDAGFGGSWRDTWSPGSPA